MCGLKLQIERDRERERHNKWRLGTSKKQNINQIFQTLELP